MSTWDAAAAKAAEHYTPERWNQALTNEDTFADLLRELARINDQPGNRGPRAQPTQAEVTVLLKQLAANTGGYATRPLHVEVSEQREANGWSIQQLANKIALSKPAAQQILNGTWTPSLATLLHIGRALHDNEFFYLETRAHMLATYVYQLATTKPHLTNALIQDLQP